MLVLVPPSDCSWSADGLTLSPLRILHDGIFRNYVKVSGAVQESDGSDLFSCIFPKFHPVDHIRRGTCAKLTSVQVSHSDADRERLGQGHNLRMIRFFATRLDFLSAEFVGGEREEGRW